MPTLFSISNPVMSVNHLPQLLQQLVGRKSRFLAQVGEGGVFDHHLSDRRVHDLEAAVELDQLLGQPRILR